eukprot:42748_1
MKRKHIHTRTISRLPPEAFIEEYINEKKEQDSQNKNDTNKNKNKKAVARVVLLGTENTGKTSIFNQLRFFCGSNPITDVELKECKSICIKQLITCAINLSRLCINNNNLFNCVLESNRKLIIKYADMNINNILNNDTMKIKKELKLIFKDTGIIETYISNNFKFQLNSQYFLNRLYKYFDNEYNCTFNDYLMVYKSTDFIHDELITDERWSITITDVSGNRNNRTQWLSLFTIRYTAMIYVISLADYNQYSNNILCYNKLIEQFELLCNLMQVKMFMQNISNIIIILNKKDIFENQVTKCNISFYEFFPIFLVERFYFKNRNKTYKDTIYDKENNNLKLIPKKKIDCNLFLINQKSMMQITL